MSVGPITGPQQSLGDLQGKLIRLLQLPIERGTARAAALNGFAAGKTGTTQENRDAWFIGFNQSLVVGVWVGNDDRSPMHEVTGGSLPAVIWKDFMTKAAPQLASAPTGAPHGEPNAFTAAEEAGSARCNLRACAARYRSFDAGDCTYQPFAADRRRQCEIEENAAARIEPGERLTDEAGQSRPQCNYEACTWTYSSFRREDCTYQPYDGGPRRLCQR